MSVVLDASTAIAWLYGEATTGEAEANLDALYRATRDQGAHVPQLWRLEVANVLLVGCRKGRHSVETMQAHLADLALLRIEVDAETHERAWHRTLELAFTHGLTSYDACYLELAQRLRAPLATLDRKQIAAATRAGIELFWGAASAG